MLKVLSIRSNEHIAHEESMVGTSTNNPDLDSVLLVPSRKAVHDVDTVSGVEIVDGTFTVDSPNLITSLLAN
jgi:hypothetical protein